MNSVTIADAKAHLSTYIKESEAEGPLVITQNGQPVAVLLPVINEADLERLVLSYNPKFQQLIEQADQRVKQDGGLSHETFWQT